MREHVEHDARLGLPTKATDANNRVARLKYDALGREVERIREWDGNATTVIAYDSCEMCADVTVASGECPGAGSASVTPATRRYFDKLGRPIRTEVEAFKDA